MNTAEFWLKHCAKEMDHAGLHFGHGTDNAHDEAAWLLLHVLGAPLDGSFQDWGYELSSEQKANMSGLLQRRIKERLPLAYLTGSARFCGLEFRVSNQTLVPRSPFAELILSGFSPWLQTGLDGSSRALDMCTGGGCIAIAMAEYLPDMVIDAVDISAAALEIAKCNVLDHGKTGRVNLIESDLFLKLSGVKYDLIVSNPPYVSAEVFAKLPPEYLAEPSGGLVCGEDGLDIVLKILDAAPLYLKKHGILVVEVGESAQTLIDLLPGVAFLWLEFDYGGDGVFLLDYEQLHTSRADVRAALEQREHV
jgi:ribosomal protein L3 glutamine methyltransferase